MVEYSNDGNTAFYNGYKFRKDRKTGYFLSSSATDSGHRERLHVYVWRVNKGAIPKGFHVHHKDENKDNNEIENLECITSFKHLQLHRTEYNDKNRHEVLENLMNKAIPKAKEWHRSEKGHEWHVQHGKDVFGNTEYIEKVCEICGKTYRVREIAKEHSRFCSNKCRAANRRKTGIDDEKRVCMGCGKTFIANKYSTAKFCSVDCRKLNGWKRKHA